MEKQFKMIIKIRVSVRVKFAAKKTQRMSNGIGASARTFPHPDAHSLQLTFKGNVSILFHLHDWYFFKFQHGGGRDAGLHLRIAPFDASDPFPVSDFVPRLYRQIYRRAATLRQDFADPVRGEKGSISAPNGCDGGPAPLSHSHTSLFYLLDHSRYENSILQLISPMSLQHFVFRWKIESLLCLLL